MSRWSLVLIVISVLWVTLNVQAELYKYRDANGVLRYTDDLSRVPQEQRPGVEALEGVKSPVRKVPAPAYGGIEQTDEAVPPGPEHQTGESGDLAELKKMNEKKRRMDEEYAQLVSEKEELVKKKKDIQTQSELTEYNEKIVDLNDRITQYEARRKAFSKEVKEFNEMMK